jgi:hypothetical protein
MKLFLKKLNPNTMSKIEKFAYYSWRNQRSRCNNPKCHAYKTYGAKGIRVEYTSREFLGWVLENIKKFNGNNPQIGRIDHSKNYSLDNIEIQSRSENCKERHRRCGPTVKRKPMICFDYKSGEPLMSFSSQFEAAKYSGTHAGTISSILHKKSNKSSGFTFKYPKDTIWSDEK